MKNIALLISIALLVSLNAFATPCGTVGAPAACAVTIFNETITFSNFALNGGSLIQNPGDIGSEITAADLLIDLSVVNNRATITFSRDGGAFEYTGSSLYDIQVFYTVTSTAPITRAYSFLKDQYTTSDVGGQQKGTASETKAICNVEDIGCTRTILAVNVNDSGGTPGTINEYVRASGAFALSSFRVDDKINFNANNASITVHEFGNAFDIATPEPLGFLLMGSGLLGLGFIYRKKARR